MGNSLENLLEFFGAGSTCNGSFLGFLPWNFYLTLNSQCGFDSTHPLVLLGAHSDVLLIFLALLDDLFRLAGLVAVIFIIFAGIQFITSGGAPEATAKARTTGINALIGLSIMLVAAAFVSFLGGQVDNNTGRNGYTASGGGLDLSSLPNPFAVSNGSIVSTVLTLTFSIMGAFSLLVIIIAGMQYTFSQGDAQAVGRAKSTIVYALIGLVLAITAQSIISLALSRAAS